MMSGKGVWNALCYVPSESVPNVTPPREILRTAQKYAVGFVQYHECRLQIGITLL
jgi:hypothetical protein